MNLKIKIPKTIISLVGPFQNKLTSPNLTTTTAYLRH